MDLILLQSLFSLYTGLKFIMMQQWNAKKNAFNELPNDSFNSFSNVDTFERFLWKFVTVFYNEKKTIMLSHFENNLIE